MVLHCSVLGCKNTNEIYLKLSFFKYPKDPERLKKWVSATRIRTLSRWSVACSDHFAEEDYYPPYTINGRRRLRETAVPSIKLPEGAPTTEDEKSDQRLFTRPRIIRVDRRLVSDLTQEVTEVEKDRRISNWEGRKTTENENNCEIDVVEGGENRRKNWEEEMLYLSDDNNYDEEEHEEEEEDEEAEHSTTLLILELDKTPLDCNDGAGMNEELIANESDVTIATLDEEQETTIEENIVTLKDNKLSGIYIKEKSHQCEFCLKNFPRPWRLRSHIERHHNEKRLQCETSNMNDELTVNENDVTVQSLDKQQETIEEMSVALENNKLSVSVPELYVHERRHQCEFCLKEFPRPWRLRNHIERHHKEKRLQCETSNMNDELTVNESDVTVQSLDKQQETIEEKSVTLENNKLSVSVTELDVQEKIHQCEFCLKHFPKQCKLRRHIERRHKEILIHCETANMIEEPTVNEIDVAVLALDERQGKTIEEKYVTLENNKLIVSAPVDMKIKKRHQCVFCLKDFLTPLTLSRHVERLHNHEENPLQCETSDMNEELNVDESDVAISSLDGQHGTIIEENIITLENNKSSVSATVVEIIKKRHQCEFCLKDFVSAYSLRRHIERHHKEKYIQCESYSMNESDVEIQSLDDHQEMIITDEVIILENTSLDSAAGVDVEVQSLNEHQEIIIADEVVTLENNTSVNATGVHNIKKVYPCEFCQKVFSSPFKLRKHTKILHFHVEKPFQCETCHKCFLLESQLTDHMKKHTNTQSFKCDICKKVLSEKEKLIGHIEVSYCQNEKHYQYETYRMTKEVAAIENDVAIESMDDQQGPTSKEKDITSQNSKSSDSVTGVASIKKGYLCEYCLKDFELPFTLHRRIERDKDRPQYETCTMNDEIIANESDVVIHSLDEEQETTNNENVVTLENDNSLASATGIKNDKSLASPTGVENDKSSVSTTGVENIKKPYLCKYCVISFVTPYALCGHIERYHKEKPSQCETSDMNEELNVDESDVAILSSHEQQGPTSKENAISLENNKSSVTATGVDSINKGQYLCGYCLKYFVTQFTLRTHIKRRHKEKLIHCETSNVNEELTVNESNMEIVSIKENIFTLKDNKLSGFDIKEKRHQCEFCLEYFQRPWRLRNHIERYHNENPLQCETYNGNEELIANEIDVAIQSLDEQQGTSIQEKVVKLPSNNSSVGATEVKIIKKRHQCEFCLKDFVSAYSLRRHIHRHHKEKRKEDCRISFSPNGQRINHINRHKREKRFQCEFCPKLFTTMYNFSSHLRIHTEERRYFECEVCKKRFLTKQRLVYHIRSHTGEKPFQCEVCGMFFPRKNALKRHIKRLHLHKRTHQCQICDKRFERRYELSQHITVMHTNETPHKCAICEQAFKLKSELNYHMWKHNGKPYKCEICNKGFIKKAAKNYHVKLHTGENPLYPCEVCGNNYRSKLYLMKHIRIHSGEKPYQCDNCSKCFLTKHGFIRHLKKHQL